MIVKMFGWLSFLAFLIIACNDNVKKKEIIPINQFCEDGYEKIYSQPSPKDQMYYNIGIEGFPEPKDDGQKKYWVRGYTQDDKGRIGYIEAPDEGRIKVSAVWIASNKGPHEGEGEIGLYINDELKKSVNIKNAEVFTKDFFIEKSSDTRIYYGAAYHFYADDVPVKAKDKILFKKIKSPVTDVIYTVICFKRK